MGGRIRTGDRARRLRDQIGFPPPHPGPLSPQGRRGSVGRAVHGPATGMPWFVWPRISSYAPPTWCPLRPASDLRGGGSVLHEMFLCVYRTEMRQFWDIVEYPGTYREIGRPYRELAAIQALPRRPAARRQDHQVTSVPAPHRPCAANCRQVVIRLMGSTPIGTVSYLTCANLRDRCSTLKDSLTRIAINWQS